jgi:hypothetical protein
MKVNNKTLKESMDKIGLQAEEQEGSPQLMAKLSQNGTEYPMFVRQLDGGNLLQMLTFVPCTIEQESFFDLSRLLHMINKELDMPGFCCDEDSRTVFYRVVIPCLSNQIDENLLLAYINTTKEICGMFGTIVQAIAINAMSLNEMMEKATELQKVKKK